MVEYELQLKATRQATPQTSEPPLSPSHADEETEQQEEVVEYEAPPPSKPPPPPSSRSRARENGRTAERRTYGIQGTAAAATAAAASGLWTPAEGSLRRGHVEEEVSTAMSGFSLCHPSVANKTLDGDNDGRVIRRRRRVSRRKGAGGRARVESKIVLKLKVKQEREGNRARTVVEHSFL